MPEDDAAEALAELERSGLVTGQPHLRFTHPILRAAIEDDMPVVERSRAHEQAARMLADRDADPVAVAAHLRSATPARATGRATRCGAPRAARRRSATPPRRSATSSARWSSGPDDGELGEVLFELGLAAAHAGDPDAPGHLERAAAAGGSTGLRALHWTAVLHLVAGRAAKAADVLEAALADVPRSPTPRSRCSRR